jgi:trk system potassium uptake protein
MKALICGAGKYTRSLLSRLGERWHITLIDRSESVLTELSHNHDTVAKAITGDASSPVLLEEADLENSDYVLALTDNDKVNLAVARYAREKGVKHILSVVRQPEFTEQYQGLDVYTLFPADRVAGTMYHYLQDPRINVFPVSQGQGELVEVLVTRDNWIAGIGIDQLDHPDWRLVAVFRDGAMLPMNDEIRVELGDRIILLGKRNFFRSVCSLLACAHMPFPTTWGRNLLVVLTDRDPAKNHPVLDECMYIVPQTSIGHLSVLRHIDTPDPSEYLAEWTGRYDIRMHVSEKNPIRQLPALCEEENIALVIIRPLETSFLKSLTTPEMTALAHSLPCPLLVARKSTPYHRILVPFKGSAKSVLALETAIDMAEQFDAAVDTVVVRQPDFIHEGNTGGSPEAIFKRVREIGHIRKMEIGEILREGNPVREIVAQSEEHDLMIIGSTQREKELLSPHVGELLIERAACSVLVIASE